MSEFGVSDSGLKSDDNEKVSADSMSPRETGTSSGEKESSSSDAVGGDTDDVDGDEDEGGEEGEVVDAGKKKKKKKSKKKKKKTMHGTTPSHCRLLGGFTDYYIKYGQTEPPTKTVASLFPSGEFPVGQVMTHGLTNTPLPKGSGYFQRVTESEKKEKERLARPELYEKVRCAAEVHRQVRRYAQSFIKPGIKLTDMCEQLEEMNRKLVNENGLEAGIGFPTGCSLNHVAAHYTPNTGDETVLQEGDVMKVDFGTQIEGRIIDCAWTVAFDEKYDPLLEAVKAATETGIKAAGIDMLMGEIGAQIEEVMESHEIELDGKVYPIKCCRNLNGHNIGAYEIHAGKSVPIVGDTNDTNSRKRMEEGEIYAIETFGSTGVGYVIELGECSHYMKSFQPPYVDLKGRTNTKNLLTHINKTFSTLAFCRRWLERDDGGSKTVNSLFGKQTDYMPSLQYLCDRGVVNEYPPLVEQAGVGSYVAQYEHTLLLRPTCKEILSRGDDY